MAQAYHSDPGGDSGSPARQLRGDEDSGGDPGGVGTPPAEAYRALTERAGVIDRSAEGRLGVSGGDRTAWLQGLVTNDVEVLAPGHGCYAAYLTPQGRMLSDLRILALAGAFLLDVPRGQVAALLERFEQFIITEDVRVWDRRSELGRLALHGPAAASILAALVGMDGDELGALREHQHLQASWEGAALLIAGARELGLAGFDVYLAPAQLPRLESAVVEGGATRVDEATWETRRVEAGRPLFGVDMTEETIPLEAGIEDRAISLTKGCYVGQEVIIRVLHRGQGRVARKLVCVLGEPGDTTSRVEPHATLVSGDREVGRVTSAVWSPDQQRFVGLGYVRRELAEPGTTLLAVSDEQRVRVSLA